MIHKSLCSTFDAIDAIKAPQTLKLETEHYLLKNYDISIVKVEKAYSAKIFFKPFAGYNSSQMHSVKFSQPVKLTSTNSTYFIPENAIHLNQHFTDFNSDDPTIEITGSIDRLSTAGDDSNFDGKYLRLVIPVISNHGKLREVRGWSYTADLSVKDRNLIKVIINNHEYHFFEFKFDENSYLVIDTTDICNAHMFKNISHNILLALGFLYGNLYLDEGFILSSTTAEFGQINDVSYSTYRESIMTGYRIHTTNAYSVHNMTGKDEKEIKANEVKVKKWIDDLVEIEEPIFSALCELFYNNEPISRAVIVTLQGNLLALEIKGSAYSLALEAITAVLMEENNENRPKPVTKEVFKELKTKFLKTLDEMLPPNDENKPARLIFKNRIENLNTPTNTDKLKRSFEIVGYDPNKDEKSALKARDKFQHGELPVSDNSDDIVFQEVYFMTLIMHRLIYTLILKRIGYSGYIINYPQLHSDITRRDLKEDLFYKL
ncbi:hypothetical protein [Pedobacter gandavensis]|uniref:hypothetical protein n=1 Tax=Pedobacter gandavensis TaxID=2679963 RepID=UPI00292CDB22|nr:hypothetical protein [Pedobacter gandavensis]